MLMYLIPKSAWVSILSHGSLRGRLRGRQQQRIANVQPQSAAIRVSFSPPQRHLKHQQVPTGHEIQFIVSTGVGNCPIFGNIGHHLIVAIIDHIPNRWVMFNGDI